MRERRGPQPGGPRPFRVRSLFGKPPALAAGGVVPRLATPQASPHLTLPCVKSAPARATSCMRIRSAARSNSCLHFSEQKKYRRFLYSVLGARSPLSPAAPQMGSYDLPFVLLSPEFTCRPPALPAAPDPAIC